ncbi:MAG: YraN family protein [Spirochaetaceae bacterium]|nr:YraN family protein [Spirochaetaceae bacterium]
MSDSISDSNSMCPADSRVASGRKGEDAAALLLAREGWRILARNFRAGRGEIDIIAEKGEVLSFVEVKSWSANSREELSRAVGSLKITRIIETSKIFIAKHRQYSGKRIRYDVFFLSSDGTPTRYEGAFDETK